MVCNLYIHAQACTHMHTHIITALTYLEEPQNGVCDSEKLVWEDSQVVRYGVIADQEKTKSTGKSILMFLKQTEKNNSRTLN